MHRNDLIRSVPLERLPSGLQFPAELAAKVSYAEAAQRLEFNGFMSKTDFDKLVRLSNDLAYQRALEQLFQKCTFSVAGQRHEARGQPLLLTGLAAAAFLATIIVAAAVWWH